MCIYYSDAFLWLKTGFLFGVNACVFIIIMLFIVKIFKIGFLFSVNACVFITMMLFFVNVHVFIIMMLFLDKNY